MEIYLIGPLKCVCCLMCRFFFSLVYTHINRVFMCGCIFFFVNGTSNEIYLFVAWNHLMYLYNSDVYICGFLFTVSFLCQSSFPQLRIFISCTIYFFVSNPRSRYIPYECMCVCVRMLKALPSIIYYIWKLKIYSLNTNGLHSHRSADIKMSCTG